MDRFAYDEIEALRIVKYQCSATLEFSADCDRRPVNRSKYAS
jgi:hypothetical protein